MLPKNNSKNIGKNFLTIILLFLILSFIFSLFFSPSKEIKEIPFSQVVSDINQGKIKEIDISKNDLKVLYKDGNKFSSRKEPEISLSQELVNYGVNKDKFKGIKVNIASSQNTWGWLGPTIIFGILPLLVFIIFFRTILKQSKIGAMQAFNFTKAKPKLFGLGDHSGQKKTSFKDVGGLKEAKTELEEVVDFLKNPKKYLKIGAKIPRGVLLIGAPGTGKTLLAKAVASEANVPFYSISGSEFIELFVGVGSARVRDLFATARKHQPSIIFIDELDAIGRSRGIGVGGGFEEREQTLNQILSEMDGFQEDNTCIVLGATNRPEILDPALLRPGRFDRRVVLDLPDLKSREEILKIHCRNKPLAKNVNLREIAERTPGFSGADLANLVNEAALLAAQKNQNKLTENDLLDSIEKVMLGPERKSHILSKEEKKISAYHEAGHALVATFCPPKGEPVRKVSIVPRGLAGGYTLKSPTEEKHFRTKKEFLGEISTLLGGYCAEKVAFGQVTTGASNDLKQASILARKLVKDFGMSKLGPITFGKKEELNFLGKEFEEKKNYSEKTAEAIDKEVEKIMIQAQEQAEKIIRSKKKILDKIANVLIAKETIEKEEFKKIVKS